MSTKLSLLTSSNIKKSMIALALPSIFALMIKAIYNLVDTGYISMLHDDTALAAVGISFPLLLIINALEQILAMGGSIILGKQLGQAHHKNRESSASYTDTASLYDQTASTLLFFSAILGVLLTGFCLIFLKPILSLLGADAKLFTPTRQYAFWLVLASLYSIPYQCMNAISRAESNVKLPCIACMTSALLNLLLDPLFIFPWGLNLGVAGASIATAISQLASFAIMFFHFYKGKSFIKLHIKFIHPTWSLLSEVIPAGFPTALTQLLAALSSMAANIVMSAILHNTFLLTAFSIVQKVIIIAYYLIIGFSQGIQPLLAYTYGSTESKRFKEVCQLSLRFMLGIGLFLSIVYCFFARLIISRFSTTPEVISCGRFLLISQIIGYPLFAFSYLITILLQIQGKGTAGSLISSMRQGILFIPLIFILPLFIGTNGLYYAQPIADLITFLLSILLFTRYKSALHTHFAFQ